jgi:hypothetical protein
MDGGGGPAPVRLELGVPGQIMPPAAAAVRFAQRAARYSFAALKELRAELSR